ncbi:MAG: transposase [Armatimonadetes bacterium]|nr:transposase [Armatimonadota bacterium]
MASTYVQLHVHLVFATKGRTPWIADDWREEFHKYIGGTVNALGAQSIIVGGVADHVHCLVGLKATTPVADLVRELKKATNAWARQRQPAFSWQEGYGAFAVSHHERDKVVAYVANQADHHRKVSSADELRKLLEDNGIVYDERYFE